MTGEPLLICDEECLRALEEDRDPSRDLWITFDTDNGQDYLGRSFIRSRGDAAIYVRAPSMNYYQDDRVAIVVNRIAERRAAFQGRVIAYGSSMGAFGALLFSRQLGATHVIAAAPPIALDPCIAHFDPRFADIEDLRRSDVRDGLSSDAQISIIYDPLNSIDRRQIDLVAELPNVARYPVPMTGHGCLHTLAHSGKLEELLSLFLKPPAVAQQAFRDQHRAIKLAVRGTLDFRFALAEHFFNRSSFERAKPLIWDVLEQNANFGPASDFMISCLKNYHASGADPTPGFVRLVSLHLKSNLLDKARGAANAGLDIVRSAPMLHIAGLVELAADLPARAIPLLEQATNAERSIPGWFVEAAYAAWLCQDWAKSEQIVDEALKLFPGDLDLMDFKLHYL